MLSCRLYLIFRIPYGFELRFKTTVSVVKVPATVLWDVDRFFVVNATLRGATAIMLPYQVALLQAAFERGRCGLLTTMQAVLLSSRLPCCTRVCSQRVSHPSYSLDLALSDIHVFGNLNIKLRIQRFTPADTVKSETQKWLWERDLPFYFQGRKVCLTVRCDS